MSIKGKPKPKATTKKGSKAGAFVKKAADVAGQTIVRELVRKGVTAILSNHSTWWKLPAKLNSGVNFARPTAVFDGANQPVMELTNIETFFTYPLFTSISQLPDESKENILMIAEQVIKQIRLELRSNLNYTVEDVAAYLQCVNALDIEIENIIKLLRTSMTANSKVQNFNRLATSSIDELNSGTGTFVTEMFADDSSVNDYLSRLIRVITDVRGLHIPISMFERNKWLFGNIFTDETNNAKTQYYINYAVGVIQETDGEILNTIDLGDTTWIDSMSIERRFNNLKQLISYINTTGSSRKNFGVIAADLEKSAIATMEIGANSFDQVNTLTPLHAVYDKTYFRALDNMQSIYNVLIRPTTLASDINNQYALIDTDLNNTDAAATVSTLQFVVPSDLKSTHIMNTLENGFWMPEIGWIVPMGTIALGATYKQDTVIQANTLIMSKLLQPNTEITQQEFLAMSLLSTVDHYSYPVIISTDNTASKIEGYIPMKEMSLRAKVNNDVIRDIHYLANLGLVTNPSL